MEDNTQTNPKSRLLALRGLGGTTGWPIYCNRFLEVIRMQIEDKIFDPKTSHEERATLVNARKVLTEGFTPEKMLQSMIVQAENELQRLENRKKE